MPRPPPPPPAASPSGAQLPEKSAFCANAMVATASTAVAMIPILARFISDSFEE
jgi:hypothetical protein